MISGAIVRRPPTFEAEARLTRRASDSNVIIPASRERWRTGISRYSLVRIRPRAREIGASNGSVTGWTVMRSAAVGHALGMARASDAEVLAPPGRGAPSYGSGRAIW